MEPTTNAPVVRDLEGKNIVVIDAISGEGERIATAYAKRGANILLSGDFGADDAGHDARAAFQERLAALRRETGNNKLWFREGNAHTPEGATDLMRKAYRLTDLAIDGVVMAGEAADEAVLQSLTGLNRHASILVVAKTGDEALKPETLGYIHTANATYHTVDADKAASFHFSARPAQVADKEDLSVQGTLAAAPQASLGQA